MTRTLGWALVLGLLGAAPAYAQNAGEAQAVVTGYIATSGCPAGVQKCFIQFGSGGGGGGGGAVTTSVTPLTYATPDTLSVGTASTALATAAQYKALQVCTLPASTTNVWLNLRGAAAVAGAGVPVFSGGGCTNLGTQALPMPTTAINAITDAGSAQTVTLAGG